MKIINQLKSKNKIKKFRSIDIKFRSLNINLVLNVLWVSGVVKGIPNKKKQPIPDHPYDFYDFIENLIDFINIWSLHQWVTSLIGLCVCYIWIGNYYNEKLRASGGWLSLNMRILMIVVDLFINFGLGLYYMNYRETFIGGLMMRCPIAISPVIFGIEMAIVLWYYHKYTLPKKKELISQEKNILHKDNLLNFEEQKEQHGRIDNTGLRFRSIKHQLSWKLRFKAFWYQLRTYGHIIPEPKGQDLEDTKREILFHHKDTIWKALSEPEKQKIRIASGNYQDKQLHIQADNAKKKEINLFRAMPKKENMLHIDITLKQDLILEEDLYLSMGFHLRETSKIAKGSSQVIKYIADDEYLEVDTLIMKGSVISGSSVHLEGSYPVARPETTYPMKMFTEPWTLREDWILTPGSFLGFGSHVQKFPATGEKEWEGGFLLRLPTELIVVKEKDIFLKQDLHLWAGWYLKKGSVLAKGSIIKTKSYSKKDFFSKLI